MNLLAAAKTVYTEGTVRNGVNYVNDHPKKNLMRAKTFSVN